MVRLALLAVLRASRVKVQKFSLPEQADERVVQSVKIDAEARASSQGMPHGFKSLVSTLTLVNR